MSFKRIKYPEDTNSYRIEIIELRPCDLIKTFGSPDTSDEYKVSGEYCFQNEDNEIFTIYDWKSTSLYDKDYPTPKCFWEFDGLVEFSIGGTSKANVEVFKNWLSNQLKEAN